MYMQGALGFSSADTPLPLKWWDYRTGMLVHGCLWSIVSFGHLLVLLPAEVFEESPDTFDLNYDE